MDPNGGNRRWGDYYMSGAKNPQEKYWALELVKHANQLIPSFNELFDQETFYLFAFVFVIGTFLTAFLLSRVIGVTIREYPQRTIPEFIGYKDVVVQSPTGSGKTLSYVVPSLEIMRRNESTWKKWQIGALILVPSRELASQVASVCSAFAEASGITNISFVGGSKTDADIKRFKELGGNIVVATPGRLEELLVDKKSNDFNLAGHLKTLQVLVVDEADRFIDMGFLKSMTSILSALPKQRRTGLFSATQAKEFEELVRFGLRNPLRITMGAEAIVRSQGDGPQGADDSVTPASLENYYAIVPTEGKLWALIEFLRKHKTAKILVFLSTCACVDYFARILAVLLKKRTLLALHGKKRATRQKLLDQFRNSPGAVMVSTDVMSRGIDVSDIDWVVQFDVPKQTSWFVHRSGRSGRCGREGKALLMLTPEESGYTQFLQTYEKVALTEIELSYSPEQAEALRLKLHKIAASDRDFLERGSTAFVSFIQSYSKHDCHLVCRLKDLDAVGCAHAYGLLRMPRMRELAGRDLSEFKRSQVNTADIAFKDKHREASRQRKIAERNSDEQNAWTQASDANAEVAIGPKLAKKLKRRAETSKQRDWDELADDFRLMQKFKKGRLSKKEFDSNFGL
uniref:ATP-dependent RNA helicase n=1 Tax=Plectus sambesii TaxID=2011161 RepID=A0A914W141_9BILA